ncbi:MAG: chemotaxis protein CheA [Capsulimonas sp.]|uniref:chemotaxis protein CheA n=1 Tax=Capsulimonas sp. TaxID=2494211 RepID=UPI0032665B4B
MINTDMSQYLGVFLDEGREQLDLLEANILKMERGDHSLEMLQMLFRAAHTLKGSSRAMGFLAIGDLTHEMENILDDLRNDKLSVDTNIVNALLDCLDALTSLVESVSATSTDAETDKDIPGLVARLNALRLGQSAPETAAVAQPAAGLPVADAPAPSFDIPVSDFEHTAIHEARAAGLSVFHISVELSPDCLMKSVRVFMVLGALEPLGTVLVSHPREEKLEEEEFELKFQLLIATERSLEEITDPLGRISEIDCITVAPWEAPDTVPVAETSAALTASEPAKLTLETVSAPTALPVAEAAARVPAKPAPKSGDAAAPAQHSQTIRVDVSRLDNLLNLIGEMVIDRTQIARISGDLRERYPQDELASHLLEATNRIARITGELQDEIMKARMLPIDGVFQRMPRMIRDLAQKTGKEVDFQMLGGETELDRSVLEVLGDPLIHLLRNSVDHGIEEPEGRDAAGKPRQGVVTMGARHEENHIVIEITDDGRGIDPVKIKAAGIKKGIITQAAADLMTDRDALSLIFASGFSTAQTISDISGRGVGMDIVRSNLEKLGGRILLDSKVGKGSKFTIHLPLTLAIVRALLVSAGGGTYVIPLSSVVEMLRLGEDNGGITRRTVGGQAVIVLRGKTVPLASVADVLCGNPRATSAERIAEDAYVVIVGFGEKQVGLCVDALAGEQEVVIKSLGMLLGDITGLSGATILGDGRVALIMDVAKAVESIRDASLAAPSLDLALKA